MENIPVSVIIKEYYDIVSPFLAFKTCERIQETEKKILTLLCAVNRREDMAAQCWEMIGNAGCLQTFSDGALLASSDDTPGNVAYDIKMEALTSCRISQVRNFEEFTFRSDLYANANKGEKNACRLLAFLNWLGAIVPRNPRAAESIWASLAMAGDWLSIKMLVYEYAQLGEEKEAEKWEHILQILKTEYEAFSVIALCSNYPGCTEEEVQTANLILFISQKNAGSGGAVIDRPMIHYVLNSRDDYQAKMEKLSGNTNYYLAMQLEDRFFHKKFGF